MNQETNYTTLSHRSLLNSHQENHIAILILKKSMTKRDTWIWPKDFLSASLICKLLSSYFPQAMPHLKQV